MYFSCFSDESDEFFQLQLTFYSIRHSCCASTCRRRIVSAACTRTYCSYFNSREGAFVRKFLRYLNYYKNAVNRLHVD